jgi:hypothetical protein
MLRMRWLSGVSPVSLACGMPNCVEFLKLSAGNRPRMNTMLCRASLLVGGGGGGEGREEERGREP